MEGQTEQAATIVSAAVSGAPTGAPTEQAAETQTTQTQTTQATEGTQTATTVATGAETQTAAPEKPYWPDDWRQRVAEYVGGGDEKAVKRELKRLERFTDPNGIYAMSRELESKFSQGGLIKKPGKDAKPEEVAEFHKALGVPDKPEDYLKDVKLASGAVIGDADKPVVTEFVGAMHKAGAPPAVVNEALNWYYKSQESQAAAIDEADDKHRVEAERALKDEYGPAYKRYTNSISSVFKTAPGGTTLENGSLFGRLMGGRTADGKIIGNDPDMVRFLVNIAREINPAATVVEDGGESGVSIENEIASLEKRMREDRPSYFKDERAQARYRELIGAREKVRARAR
jgi:hypothetical protein